MAAWAFVIVLECEHHGSSCYRYYGAFSSPLTSAIIEAHSFADVGEVLNDALSAEAVGMIWAMAWVTQHRFRCPSVIHFDNNTVGNHAAGLAQWNPTWEYEKLHRALTAIRHIHQTIGLSVRFQHVKSHNGHPWNEAVDSIAKATAKRIIYGVHMPSHVSKLLQHPYIGMAWMYLTDTATPKPHALRASFACEGPFEFQAEDTTWWQPSTTQERSHVQVHIVVATSNVLSLEAGTKKAQQAGLMQLGKIATLQAQYDDAKVNIIGIQEGRAQGTHVRHSTSHLVYQGGATGQGTHGCELWLSRRIPYATYDGTQFYFAPNHVHIASYSCRHILAVVKAQHLHIRVLVLHAPHSQATDVDVEQWWDEITKMLQRSPITLPLIFLGDMNARIGSIPSESVSVHHAEQETETGHLFHAFLLENRLWTPSTDETCHQGLSHTWVSTDGSQHRLDFVVLPLSWRQYQIESWVGYDLDLMTAHQDHFAVLASISMQVSSHFSKGSRPRIDIRKCNDETARAQFQEYLSHPPQIPWEAGVGHHAEVLTSWIQQGAAHFFSEDKQLPKQRYMSTSTWSIVQVRKQLLKISTNARGHVHRCFMIQLINQWRCLALMRKGKHAKIPSVQMRIMAAHAIYKKCHVTQWWAIVHRRRLHGLARSCSRQDRVRHTEQLVQDMIAAGRIKDSRAIYKSLRPLLGQEFRRSKTQFRPLPAVQKPNHVLAADHQEAAETWREHFAGPEHGIHVQSHQLQELATLQAPRYTHGTIPFDLQVIPQLQSIERYIMKAKHNKCPGPDGVPSEIYQLAPSVFASLIYPLLVKCSVRCTEPLRWRGGDVVALPKALHVGNRLEQFRSILLSDFSSKIYHGLIRQQMLNGFQSYRLSTQAGGVPGIGTDVLNLYVQSFAQICRHTARSSASLYIDVTQAFYRACRPLIVTRKHLSDDSLARFFRDSGWPPNMFNDFLNHVRSPSALASAHLSAHQQAQINSLLTTTWFRLRNSDDTLTATDSGTRPGDSIADLLFAYLMSRFLRDLHQGCEARGLSLDLPISWAPYGPVQPDEIDPLQALHACWVDDLILLLAADQPEGLLIKITDTIAMVQDLAATYCLRLNYGPNKTATVVALRGPGSRKVWNTLMQDSAASPHLTFTCGSLQGPQTIAITPDYVYLGVLHDQQGHPACEVKRKFLSLQAPTRLLRKGVFKSPYLDFSIKKMLFKSLTLSKLLFSAGSWQTMNIGTQQTWDTQFMNLYRKLARITPGPHVTNLDVLADCLEPHPHMVLFCQRLNLLDRVMQCDMPELFAVLQYQDVTTGWMGLVCSDLERVAVFGIPEDILHAARQKDFAWIAHHSFVHPKVFTKLAKHVVKQYCGYLQLWRTFRTFQSTFEKEARDWGITWIQSDMPTRSVDSFQCEVCSARFNTFAALCTHIFKQHQTLNIAQKYTSSNTCRGCLKCYDSRAQVIQHLKYYRTGCLLKLVISVPPLSDDDLHELLAEEQAAHKLQVRQQRTARHRYPLVQAAGPQRAWPWQRASQFDTTETPATASTIDPDWMQHILEAVATGSVEHIFAALSQRPYQGPHARCITDTVVGMLNTKESVHDASLFGMLQEAITAWRSSAQVIAPNPCQPISWAGMQHPLSQIRIPPDHVDHAHESYVDKRHKHLNETWEAYDVVLQMRKQMHYEHSKRYSFSAPRELQLLPCPVYLYVFSGRRRPGDYQQHVEELLTRHSIPGRVLLVDLALSECHNVYDSALVSKLMHWIRSGFVGALLIAPPCETWSAARALECPGIKAPRPLRSASDPFSLQGCTHSELQQLEVSNFLLLIAIRLMVAATMYGVPATMEHPRQPKEDAAPSIWKLPWIVAMIEAGLWRRVLLWQAKYGAPSAKPTFFAIAHQPNFDQIRAHYEEPVDWTALEVLQGRDSSGAWRTSKGEEYPARLNRCLAHSHVRAVQSKQQVDSYDRHAYSLFDHDFQQLYAGDCNIAEQSLQPDFHGRTLLQTMD
eukprot:Skav220612  [mRNA]  locus=scaffold507:296315:302257:- [translate_table: standard]